MDSKYGQYPVFSWSNSRHDCLESCERKYFHQYYGSHLGWSDDIAVPTERRLAYRLKQLTSLHATLGSTVHTLCQERVEAIRDGTRWLGGIPAVDASIRRSLRKVCITSRDLDGFRRHPKGHGMLQSFYYRGRYDLNEVEAVGRKIGACARNIVEHPVWRELEALPSEAFLAIERLDTFDIGGIPVWIKADVIYTDGTRVIVHDWKTRADDEYPAEQQVSLYALYARDRLGLPFRDGHWTGRIVNLVTGVDQCIRLTGEDLAEAETRIHRSVGLMKELVVDDVLNQPMTKEHFPLLNPALRQRCEYCPFFELCEGELKSTGRLRRISTLSRAGIGEM